MIRNEMWLVVLAGLTGVVVGIKTWVSREIDRAVTWDKEIIWE